MATKSDFMEQTGHANSQAQTATMSLPSDETTFRYRTAASSEEQTEYDLREPLWTHFGSDEAAAYYYKVQILNTLRQFASDGSGMRSGLVSQRSVARMLAMDDVTFAFLFSQRQVPYDNMEITTIYELLTEEGTEPTPGQLVSDWVDVNYIPTRTIDLYMGVERCKDVQPFPEEKAFYWICKKNIKIRSRAEMYTMRYTPRVVFPYLCESTERPQGVPLAHTIDSAMDELESIPKPQLATLDRLVPAFKMSEDTDKIVVKKEYPLYLQRRREENSIATAERCERRDKVKAHYETVRLVTRKRELFMPTDDRAEIVIDDGFGPIRSPPAGIFELAADSSHEIRPENVTEACHKIVPQNIETADNTIYELEGSPAVPEAPAQTTCSHVCWTCYISSVAREAKGFVQGLWTSVKNWWQSL